MKVREWWIEFGGDPSDDKEVYKRYSASVPFKPTDFSDEVVHCIEFKAYEVLKEQAEKLAAALAALYEEVHCHPDSPSVPDSKFHHILNANAALAEYERFKGKK